MDESSDQLPEQSRGFSSLFWVGLIVLAGVILVVVSMRSGQRGGQQKAGRSPRAVPGVGSQLPYAYFEPLTGGTKAIQTDDLKGKVVLIDYWGPWCQYCAVEFPDLVKLERDHRADPNFLFLSISTDGGDDGRPSDLAESTTRFLKRYDATFPTYVDRGGRNRSYLATLMQQGNFFYPTTVLVNREGAIVAIWPGYDEDYARQMREEVEKLLAEKPADAKN